MQKEYDVVIAGGGLAGLTLSIQLKQANPNISILILDFNRINGIWLKVLSITSKKISLSSLLNFGRNIKLCTWNYYILQG